MGPGVDAETRVRRGDAQGLPARLRPDRVRPPQRPAHRHHDRREHGDRPLRGVGGVPSVFRRRRFRPMPRRRHRHARIPPDGSGYGMWSVVHGRGRRGPPRMAAQREKPSLEVGHAARRRRLAPFHLRGERHAHEPILHPQAGREAHAHKDDPPVPDAREREADRPAVPDRRRGGVRRRTRGGAAGRMAVEERVSRPSAPVSPRSNTTDSPRSCVPTARRTWR